jgi:hypothetical protein
MSLAEILSNDSVKSIDQGAIYVDTLTIKDEQQGTSYTHSVDDNGHYHIVGNAGLKLLSFSPQDGLNDCVVKQHVSTQLGSAVSLLTQTITQQNVSSLQALVNQQQDEINSLKTYINNLKLFLQSFQECIFMEGQPGTGAEFSYENLV